MVVPSRVLRAVAAAALALATTAATATVTTAPATASPSAPSAPSSPSSPSSPGATGTAGSEDGTGSTSDTGDTSDTGTSAADDDSPLRVSIDELTPGVLPRSGPLVVTGTVVNDDVETWREVNLYPLFNAGPRCVACAPVMTTEAEVAAGADTDADTPVGERYTRDDQVRAVVGDLGPGQAAGFTITVPQRVLRELFADPQPGVYWFGVHAIGSSDSSPRDDVSDGRARTFLPYLPAGAPSVETAVVLPLRARIVRGRDGAIARTSSWAEALDPDGRLGAPLAFGAAAGPRAFTWLLDPAVPDAVRALALGNPARSLSPDDDATDPEDPAATPAASPSSDPGAAGTDPGGTDSTDESDEGDGSDEGDAGAADDPLARAATTWLAQGRTLLGAHPVARLPYGDPDLDTLGEERPGLYDTARRHRAVVLDAWGIAGLPVTTGPGGRLSRPALEAADDDSTLLLTDTLFPAETFSATPPVDGLLGEHPVVVTSPTVGESGSTTGQTAQQGQQTPLALRQRLLSEAAVRSLAATEDGEARPAPLTVVLPAQLDVTRAAAFWAGLDAPWVRLVGLDALRAPSTNVPAADRRIAAGDLALRRASGRLPDTAVSEAVRILRGARTLQRILGDDVEVSEDLVGEALSGLSFSMRGDDGAVARLTAARDWVEERLGRVSIDAPAQANLASESGTFNVALRNGLARPVTVRIVSSGDDGALVEVARPVTIAARSRVSVPVEARMSRPGVHNVELRLVDSEGDQVGAADTIAVRSAQVGVVIWAIMGTGVAILAGAIALRLRRRIRGERSAAEVGAG